MWIVGSMLFGERNPIAGSGRSKKYRLARWRGVSPSGGTVNSY